MIAVTPRHGPQDERTRALVDHVRSTAIPAALSGTGASAYVGGRTARYGDEAEKIASRIPLFAAAVVGLSLLLLLAAFRSWRISVLSAAFNLASIAAAYGVVALAFQTAGGAALLGVEQQPVVPYVPLFMFAILFGLSTDYNVFLLSRVREEWGRHADHRAAIAAASASTRKIITAAGGIMIAVFLGFATDPDPVIKMTGIGLATAVLVDVTLVRLFMAPAALTLLGDRLWPSRAAGCHAWVPRLRTRSDRDLLVITARPPRTDGEGRGGEQDAHEPGTRRRLAGAREGFGERVAEHGEGDGPHERAGDAVGQQPAHRDASAADHERQRGAQETREAAEKQGLAAVAFEEGVDAREPGGAEPDTAPCRSRNGRPRRRPSSRLTRSPATAAALTSAIMASNEASPRSAATPASKSASSPWITKPRSAVVSKNTSTATTR